MAIREARELDIAKLPQEEVLSLIIAHAKNHDQLYHESGFIAAMTDLSRNIKIHVTEDFLLDMPGQETRKYLGFNTEYPYEFSKVYGGYKFFVLPRIEC